jgi:precorrin-2 methylase
MTQRPPAPALVALALAAPLALFAQAPTPDFSGQWELNRGLSDDAAAKVKEVAGPNDVAGAKTVGGQTFFPRASYGKDVDRVNLRQFLLEAVAGLSALEIEQTAAEIKTVHGEDGVRIFPFGREGAGLSVEGAVLKRRTRWQGEQLVLESESGKTRLLEVLSPLPARRQLVYSLRYEAEVFKKPLEVRLVYDRAPAARP